MRLSIPADALLYFPPNSSSIDRILPASLQHLQLKPCNNRFILLWFPNLAAAFLQGKFPRLNRFDLHLQISWRETLIFIDQGWGCLQPLQGVTEQLVQQFGVDVRGYNSSGRCIGTLLSEMQARSLLSDFERWYPMQGDGEYSSILERRLAGTPRRRSKEEAIAFVRQDLPAQGTASSSEFLNCLLGPQKARARKVVFRPNVKLAGTATLSFHQDPEDLPKVIEVNFTSCFADWLSLKAAIPHTVESAFISVQGSFANMGREFTGEYILSPRLIYPSIFYRSNIS